MKVEEGLVGGINLRLVVKMLCMKGVRWEMVKEEKCERGELG